MKHARDDRERVAAAHRPADRSSRDGPGRSTGLGACKATGGGYIDAPLDGGVIGHYIGDANFGFNFTCEVDMAKKRTVIKGEITYHDDPSNVSLIDYPEIRLHGTVKDIVFLGVTECGDAVDELFGSDPTAGTPFDGIPTAEFEGTYRPQDTDVTLPVGKTSRRARSRFWWATRVSRLALVESSLGTYS